MPAPPETTVAPATPTAAPTGTPTNVRSIRRLMLVAGCVYLSWWFVVEAVLPGSYNPLSSRLAVVSAFWLSFAASFASPAVERHLDVVFTACAWLLTAHYYLLFHGNHGDMPWAVGAYVVVVAVSACIPTRGSLWTYSLLTLALGLAVSLADRALLRTIFLPGLVTMVLLTNLSLHNRLLLEKERVERARLEVARAVAERNVALRDEFISIASHELRTPLASLQLAVQRLSRVGRRSDAPPSSTVLAESVEICARQTTRLTRLVEELLDASQAASGRLALQVDDVSLLDVARDVAQTFATDGARCGSAIEVAGDPAVRGRWDRTRLEQVISNLLRNALTFGPGKPIRVAVTADDAAARLSVTDHGIGIAPEDQARIFGRFERAVPAMNYGGMGLGLYVVSQIVEAHRGHVRVESEPGQGATFIVDLPRAGCDA